MRRWELGFFAFWKMRTLITTAPSYGDALTPFRSPGASTTAEDSPGDLHGASTRTYQISHIICGEYKAVSVMTNDWHVTELCQLFKIQKAG